MPVSSLNGVDVQGPAAASDVLPILVADHPAIDFLNTVAAPAGEIIDWLSDGRSTLAWLNAAGLLDRAGTGDARPAAVGELEAIATELRLLRTWWRGFVEKHAGRPLKAVSVAELGPLNLLLSQDRTFRQIEFRRGTKTEPAGPVWNRRRTSLPTRLSLLLPVADAIGDLITAEDFSMIRRCEGTGCVLSFLDRTKSHRRRWCSMAICGNRIKAANHRARQRGSD